MLNDAIDMVRQGYIDYVYCHLLPPAGNEKLLGQYERQFRGEVDPLELPPGEPVRLQQGEVLVASCKI